MQRTFLVTIELSDPTTADAVAADIHESLLEDGHSVVSVKPWASPNPDPTNLDQPPGFSLSAERLF